MKTRYVPVRVVDSSNFDIAYALCVLQDEHYDDVYNLLIKMNELLCTPFSLNNKIKHPDALKELCAQFQLHKDALKFGRELFAGQFFARSNHLIARYMVWKLSDGKIDFRNHLTDPFAEREPKLLEAYKLSNSKTAFPSLPDSSVEIEGYRFLSYENYLVLSNGGLIEYEMIAPSLNKHIAKGLPISDFTVSKEIASNYIFNKNLPLSTLDGVPFAERITMVCLDVDYLTELNLKDELPNFIAKHDIANPFTEYKEIRNATRFKKLMQFANIVSDRMIADSGAEILTGSKLCYITQGGIGSGKSTLMRYIESQSREDFLALSLDKSRDYCKLMDFFVKCKHHSDDYKTLEYLCRVIMELALQKALDKGLNILFDSTGIPYKGRLDSVTKRMKDLGYKIGLLSASAPLSTERDRKDMDASIFVRVMKRLRKKKRAVPWDIVIRKHVMHPKAFLDSILDENLSEILIYDTMQKKGETKLLGRVFEINQECAQKIDYAKTIDNAYLLATLSKLVDYNFSSANHNKLECLFFKTQHKIRILVIFDKIKFIDLLQKASFNMQALNYEELEYNTLPYHMPMLDFVDYDRGEKNNYIIRTQKL